MHNFWSNIIKPIIERIDANYIVEIGSDTGINTKNILEYCVDHNGHMTAIDPLPKFDVDEVKAKYGNRFEIYLELSLSRLPLLNDYDVILIDGDHNWYTVYNELKIIEKNFKNKKFPLVFLHDVGWPYARRDLYYNPENIPKDYRQPFKKLGMHPNQTTLLEKGGMNPSFYNAINENSPKNGVLTAVEDFIDESDLVFSFKTINAFYGLGILFPEDDDLDNEIENLLKNSNLLNKLEKLRINLQIAHAEKINRNNLLEKQLNEVKIKLEQKENQLRETENQLKSAKELIKIKERSIQNLKKENEKRE